MAAPLLGKQKETDIRELFTLFNTVYAVSYCYIIDWICRLGCFYCKPATSGNPNKFRS